MLPFQQDVSPPAEVLWQPGTDLFLSMCCLVQAFWVRWQNRQQPAVSSPGLLLPGVSLCWGRSQWILPGWLFHLLCFAFGFSGGSCACYFRGMLQVFFLSFLLGCALLWRQAVRWAFSLCVVFLCFVAFFFPIFLIGFALPCFALLCSFPFFAFADDFSLLLLWLGFCTVCFSLLLLLYRAVPFFACLACLAWRIPFLFL